MRMTTESEKAQVKDGMPVERLGRRRRKRPWVLDEVILEEWFDVAAVELVVVRRQVVG